MKTTVIVVGVVVVGLVLLGLAWVMSGPRFQARSRGRRPDYQASRTERHAAAGQQARNINQGGPGNL